MARSRVRFAGKALEPPRCRCGHADDDERNHQKRAGLAAAIDEMARAQGRHDHDERQACAGEYEQVSSARTVCRITAEKPRWIRKGCVTARFTPTEDRMHHEERNRAAAGDREEPGRPSPAQPVDALRCEL